MTDYTPILHLPQVSPGQNQKETTINTALAILEAAMNDAALISAANADVVVNQDQFTKYFLLQVAGHTVDRLLTVPATNRWFAVENQGSGKLTVTVGAGGRALDIPAGKIALVISDGHDVRALVPDPTGGVGDLEDLTNVAGPPADGNILRYDAASSLWKPIASPFASSFLQLSDVPDYRTSPGKVVAINSSGTGLVYVTNASNIHNFTDLDDSPHDYAGKQGWSLRVNGTANGLVFAQPKLTDNLDFPASYTGAGKKFLRVAADASGVGFSTMGVVDLADGPGAPASASALRYVRVKADGSGLEYATGTGGPDHFNQLLDCPQSYIGAGGKFVRVAADASGIVFGGAGLIELSDAPTSYAGKKGLFLQVNGAETGTIFAAPSVASLSDGPGAPASGAALKVVRVKAGGGGLEYAQVAVTDLAKFPSSLIGQGGKYLQVKSDETGITFTTATYTSSFTNLTDAPQSYVGQAGKVVQVTSDEKGVTFGRVRFIDLSDAPSAYVAGKFVRVNSGATGLEFVDAPTGGGSGGTAPVYPASAYWRLSFSAAVAPPGIDIAEIEFHAAVGGPNLAVSANGAPMAQVASDHSYQQYVPANAFDGSTSTVCGNGNVNGALPLNIGFQFSSPISVAEVALTAGDHNYPATFDVQYSATGADGSWVTAWSVVGETAWSAHEKRTYQPHAAIGRLIDLTDAPHSYAGQGGRAVTVKPDATGLQFTTPTLAGLGDVDETTAPTAGQALVFDGVAGKWKPGTVASSGGGDTDAGTGPGAAHAYWRLQFDSVNTPGNLWIAEVQFRATAGVSATPTGGTPIATTGSQHPEQAFDGSGSTFWNQGSADTNGIWLGYHFATPVQVREIAVTPFGASYTPNTYDIQFSDTGLDGSWTTAWTVSAQTGWTNPETRTSPNPNPAGASSGGGSGGATTLAGLTDVSEATAPADGQVLTYVAADAKWEPKTPAAGGGTGGASTLAALTDVDETTPPTDGQALVYDATESKWKPETVTAGSSGPVTVATPGLYAPPLAADFPTVLDPTTAGVTVTDAPVGLVVNTRQGAGPVCLRGVLRPAPTDGSWEVVARLVPTTDAEAYYHVGMALTNGQGLYFTFGRTYNGGWRYEAINWSSATAFSGVAFNNTSFMDGADFFRLTCDGTTISGYISADGVTWRLLGTTTVSSFLGTITGVGVISNMQLPQGTGDYGFCLPYYRDTDRPARLPAYSGGSGGGSGGATTLAGLSDVDEPTTPTDGQVLTYNATAGKWQAKAGGGGSGGGSLATLSDVSEPSTPSDGQVLTYVAADSKWEPKAVPGAPTAAFDPGGYTSYSYKDHGKTVVVRGGSGVTLQLLSPTELSAPNNAVGVGAQVAFVQVGAGAISFTVSGGDGVQMTQSPGRQAVTAGPGSTVVARYVQDAANRALWVLSGDLLAA